MNFNHQSKTCIEIDSAKIYYEELENPQKQPLIFLHGGFGNMEDFNGIIPLLKNEYRIIGIDSRGQGKSTLGEKGLTYARLEEDVRIIIEKLNLINSIIIGFSDGGIVGLRLASAKEISIEKLIVIGSTWHSKSLENSKHILGGITANSWKEKFPKTFEIYQRINPTSDFDKLTETIIPMWIDETESGQPNEKVEKITCPTLIVQGDKDFLVEKRHTLELSEKINDSNLANIPFCGHEVYVDQPELLMNIINQFLI